MNLRSKLGELVKILIENMHVWRKLILVLSCVVVFTTTYILILPAFTLEKDKAEDLGGIHLTGMTAEQSYEASDDYSSDVQDSQPAGLQSDNTANADDGQDNEAGSPDSESDGIINDDPNTTADENESAPEHSDAKQADNENSAQSDPEGEDNSEPSAALNSEDSSNDSGDSAASDNSEDPQDSDNSKDHQDSDDTSSDDTDDEKDSDEDENPDSSLLEFEGEGYTVSVEDPQHVLPAGTKLSVSEITSDDDKYEKYCTDALAALQDAEDINVDSEAEPGFVRLYDIKLLHDGETIEPDDAVKVIISYDRNDESNKGDNALRVEDKDNVYVVHFAEDEKTGEEQAEVLDKDAATFQVRRKQLEEAEFEADSFSVYAIVDAPEPVGARKVEKINELLDDEHAKNGFYLSVTKEKDAPLGTLYFKNTLNGNNAFVVANNIEEGSVWFFEDAGNEGFYISTYVNGVKKYISNPSGNNAGLVNEGDNSRTAFEITKAPNQTFLIKIKGQNKWLQYSNGGGGFRFYSNAGNQENPRISLTYADSIDIPDDPYSLDGKTTGIAYDSGSFFCTALMQDSGSPESVAAEDMTELETEGYEDKLYVPAKSDITEWTFHKIEKDKYYITSPDGKYLTISNGSASLSDTPTDNSIIRVVPGSGSNKGYYSFTANGCTLVMTGTEGNRNFTGTSGTGGKKWFKFAEKSNLSDDEGLVYTAKKISASDPASEVVLYTRVWNETKSKYEFYVVDYNGNLLPCHDSGDVIKWVGSQYETAVWELTDHKKENGQDDPVPNGYYELKNKYSGQYIKPQLDSGSIFADGESFLNLDGRFYQEDYTTVKCWDDTYYSYAGLKVDLENNRVVPCPAAQADDFYFARVKAPVPGLTEVETIDNDDFGISMRMIDFNNPKVSDRDSKQTEFFGKDSDRTGLLSTDIKDDGYPVATVKNESLGSLYAGATGADQLFIKSIYDESGYFEYDSTKNFAELNGGEFTVYDQLATIEREDKNTMYHGQFMPYNSLINPETNEPWPYSEKFTNKTTVTGSPLSHEDPRYGEGLHEIPKAKADYFFGMEMTAKFTQTPSGKDAWGHDIIFEFSGDDDFWFYVNGELVLDLGGVHSAMTGSVNFSTGIVTGRNGTTTTLREVFRKNYLARNPGASEAEVNEYLDGFFKDGGTVFEDYSTNEMKIFFMERGAGASNLRMRFNLTAVKPGEVTLSKEVTGSDDIDYDLMEFPYRILYRTRDYGADGEEHLSDYIEVVQNAADPSVTYKGSKRPVKYAESFTPAGDTQTYHKVFFLRPGEEASIKLPENTADYKIVECGVNMNIFKSVSVNNEKLSGESDTGRHSYTTAPASIDDRAEVKFENEVDPDSLRTLTISKVLWDENGFTVQDPDTEDETKVGTKLIGYDDDETTFDLRIAMSASDSDTLVPTRNKKYFVKDPAGNYCKWNPQTTRFESLGISDYADLAEYIDGLSELEKAAVIFETSNNGAVSKIPGGYSIEFRGLPVDSSFKVEERADEIPVGYKLVEYERDKGSYISDEPDHPNQGVIRANEDPHVLVHNKRGWGLSVEKVWSDADYMESHDDIYFAVYIKDKITEQPVLLDGSVRSMESGQTSLYYYFDEIQTGASFEDYEVYEVNLTNPQTDAQGNVTYDGIERLEEGNTLVTGGKPVGKDHQDGFSYKVAYTKGEITGGNENAKNVREDVVTNTRKGIKLVKTDWNGAALPGAVFTLKDDEGTVIGSNTNTSDEDGLITIAYLDPGTDYTLEETSAPAGFSKPSKPWTIHVSTNNSISVDGDEGSYEITPETGDEMAVITLRNKGYSLQALKVNEDGDKLADAVFALYKQVNAAGGALKVKDQNPMSGYEALTTGSDGLIPKITSALPPGVYYLSEVTPPSGYKKLAGDLVFTVSSEGTVTIPEHVNSDDTDSVVILNNLDGSEVSDWIGSSEQDGHVTYTVTIPNETAGVPVKIIKTDQSAAALEGAVFSISGDGIEDEDNLVSSIAQGEEDAVIYSNSALPIGSYTLTETDTPDGYIAPEAPFTINVANTESGIQVTASMGETAIEYPDVYYDREAGVWVIRIRNQMGVELPHTGGTGTGLYYILGSLLVLLAGGAMLLRRKGITG